MSMCRFLTLITAVFALSMANVAAAGVIDQFNSPAGNNALATTIMSPTGPIAFSGPASTAGAAFGNGTRTGSMTISGATGTGGSVIVQGSVGQLAINMGDGSSGVSVLTYTAPGGANFTNTISINTALLSIDTNNNIGIALALKDTANAVSNTISFAALGAPQNLVFNLAAFAGVNKAAIKELNFTFTSSTAADATIAPILTVDQQQLVPEPTSLLAWGTVAVGGFFLRRRKARVA